MMKKEDWKKLNNSLGAQMALPILYVPLFCTKELFDDKWLSFAFFLVAFIAGGFLLSYAMNRLLGGVDAKAVNQDRRLRGGCVIYIVQVPIAALFMCIVEDYPLWGWLLMGAFVVFNFIAAYSICKQYIMKKEDGDDRILQA